MDICLTVNRSFLLQIRQCARQECSDVLKENVSRHYGFAITRKTAKEGKMNFKLVVSITKSNIVIFQCLFVDYRLLYNVLLFYVVVIYAF